MKLLQQFVDQSNHDKLSRHLYYLSSILLKTDRPKILLLSPSTADINLVNHYFPSAIYFATDYFVWDLNFAFPVANVEFDLVIVSNVFMYSPNPTQWFENVMAISRYILVQDLISRKRSNLYPYLGNDGDSIRFEFASRGVKSDFDGAYNLDNVGAYCLDFESYPGIKNEYYTEGDSPPIHFVFLLSGAISTVSSNSPGPLFKFMYFVRLYWHMWGRLASKIISTYFRFRRFFRVNL